MCMPCKLRGPPPCRTINHPRLGMPLEKNKNKKRHWRENRRDAIRYEWQYIDNFESSFRPFVSTWPQNTTESFSACAIFSSLTDNMRIATSLSRKQRLYPYGSLDLCDCPKNDDKNLHARFLPSTHDAPSKSICYAKNETMRRNGSRQSASLPFRLIPWGQFTLRAGLASSFRIASLLAPL